VTKTPLKKGEINPMNIGHNPIEINALDTYLYLTKKDGNRKV
jgi:hypothetical protein